MPSTGDEDDYFLEGGPCPRCKRGVVQSGYGLMGGGLGTYWLCSEPTCEFFIKVQDAPE